MNTGLKVFISATSSDLQRYRGAVRDALLAADILPIVQEHFPPDHRSLDAFLRDRIATCDAVICLVGFTFGAAPQTESLRSYTQIEYDVAYELDKPIYVFLADDALLDPHPEKDEERWELQRRHREALMDRHKCEIFSSVSELRLKIAQLIPKLHKLGRLPIFYLHPPAPPSYFAGRTEELAQLSAASKKDHPSTIAVVGMGGQGKTTLVYQWLRMQSHVPFAAGFWCTAYRGGFTFDMFLDEALAYLVQEKFDKRSSVDVHTRITQLLNQLQRRPILLVIDGIERWLRGWNQDGSNGEGTETTRGRTGYFEGLDTFLREVSGLHNGTHVILTTRALPAALDQVSCSIIPVYEEPDTDLALRGLDPEASIALLRELGVKGEAEQLQRLAKRYAYYPLALTVLGGILRKKYGGDVSQLPKEPAPEPQQGLFQLFEEVRRNLPGGSRTESILQAASLSFESPSLAALAAVLSDESPSEDDLRNRAVMLADWHLVRWDGAAARLHVHPLVKQHFSELLEPSEAQAIHRQYSTWYEAQPIPPGPVTLEDVKTRILAIEHALSAGDLGRCMELCFARLTPEHTFPEWLVAWGHQSTGVDLFARAAERSSPPQRVQYLTVQAAFLRQLGKLSGAEQRLDESIHLLRTSNMSPRMSRVNLVGALMNRANVLRQLAKSRKAIQDLDEAHDLLSQLPPGDSDRREQMAAVHLNRGVVFREHGEFSKALTDDARAIELYQKLVEGGQTHLRPTWITAVLNQGIVRADLRTYTEALLDFEEADRLVDGLLAEGREEMKAIHAQIAVTKAGTLQEMERDEEALQTLDQAIPVLKDLVNAGRSDLEPLLALGWLSRSIAYLHLERWPDALQASEGAIRQYEQLISDGRNDQRGWLAHVLMNRAEARYRLGKTERAAEDRARALDLMSRLIEGGEPEIRVLLLKKCVEAVSYLIEQDSDEAFRLVEHAVSEVERGMEEGQTVEALRLESRDALERLIPCRGQLEAGNGSRGVLGRLRDCASGD